MKALVDRGFSRCLSSGNISSDCNFSIILRKELTEEKKNEIHQIIFELKTEKYTKIEKR